MHAPFVLTPAYGRDYKSKAALEADLLAGKDFTANGPGGESTYANLQDLQEAGYTQVQVRKAGTAATAARAGTRG